MRELASTCNAKKWLGSDGALSLDTCLPHSNWTLKSGQTPICNLQPKPSVTGSSFYIHLLFVFPCISLIFSSFLYSCAKRGKYTSIQIEIQIGHHTQMVFLPVYEIRGIFEDSSGWLLLAWQCQRQT